MLRRSHGMVIRAQNAFLFPRLLHGKCLRGVLLFKGHAITMDPLQQNGPGRRSSVCALQTAENSKDGGELTDFHGGFRLWKYFLSRFIETGLANDVALKGYRFARR